MLKMITITNAIIASGQHDAQLFNADGARQSPIAMIIGPVTTGGKVIFAALLGILTGLFRIYGNSAEGVSYAIIFCNLLVPLIEKITVPKAFGVVKEKKNKEAV